MSKSGLTFHIKTTQHNSIEIPSIKRRTAESAKIFLELQPCSAGRVYGSSEAMAPGPRDIRTRNSSMLLYRTLGTSFHLRIPFATAVTCFQHVQRRYLRPYHHTEQLTSGSRRRRDATIIAPLERSGAASRRRLGLDCRRQLVDSLTTTPST